MIVLYYSLKETYDLAKFSFFYFRRTCLFPCADHLASTIATPHLSQAIMLVLGGI
jgi:hypothetical protein